MYINLYFHVNIDLFFKISIFNKRIATASTFFIETSLYFDRKLCFVLLHNLMRLMFSCFCFCFALFWVLFCVCVVFLFCLLLPCFWNSSYLPLRLNPNSNVRESVATAHIITPILAITPDVITQNLGPNLSTRALDNRPI